MAANPERGEVELVIGEEKGVICAEMGRLAALSGSIGTKSLTDLFERAQGVEPLTVYAIIDTMLIDGDLKAMRRAIKNPSDLAKVSAAFLKSLSFFIEGDDGKKGEGETETR